MSHLRARALLTAGLMVAMLFPATPASAAPDPGGLMLYSANNNLYTINPNGTGQSLFLANAYNGSFSPDGKRMVYERSGQLRIREATGTERTLTSGGNPEWSPDGTKIVFEADVQPDPSCPECYEHGILTITPAGTSRTLVESGYGSNYGVIDPTIDRLGGIGYIYWASHMGAGEYMTFSPGGSGGCGENYDCHSDVDGSGAPQFSPNGLQIAYREIGGSIHVVNTNGTNRRNLGIGGHRPVWSPDGKQIAFTRGGDIWVMNADGTGRRQVTFTWDVSETMNDWRNTCITGTELADTIRGTAGNDVICAMGGNDTIYGGGGNDTIYGEGGNDTVYGEGGNDTIYGGVGEDTIRGAAGNDTLRGGAGVDKLYGELNDDAIFGEAGNDLVRGGDGIDKVDGGSEHDTLYGDPGNDALAGGLGTDWCDGGTGTDKQSACETRVSVP